jgi:hypothetical protein
MLYEKFFPEERENIVISSFWSAFPLPKIFPGILSGRFPGEYQQLVTGILAETSRHRYLPPTERETSAKLPRNLQKKMAFKTKLYNYIS